MANKKITELETASSANEDDVLLIVTDVANTAIVAAKQISVGDLLKTSSVSEDLAGSTTSVNSSNYQTEATEIDLTKKVCVLDAGAANDGSMHFYLPDGYEGQVMYLVAKEGENMPQTYVWADNFRIYNSGTIRQALSFYPFTSVWPRTAMLAVFAAGAWNIDTDQYD